jgi:hypothetical protein
LGAQGGEPFEQCLVRFDVPGSEGTKEVRVSVGEAVAAVLGFGAATLDCACGHTNFTLNNLLACLIATDLLQARLAEPIQRGRGDAAASAMDGD